MGLPRFGKQTTFPRLNIIPYKFQRNFAKKTWAFIARAAPPLCFFTLEWSAAPCGAFCRARFLGRASHCYNSSDDFGRRWALPSSLVFLPLLGRRQHQGTAARKNVTRFVTSQTLHQNAQSSSLQRRVVTSDTEPTGRRGRVRHRNRRLPSREFTRNTKHHEAP